MRGWGWDGGLWLVGLWGGACARVVVGLGLEGWRVGGRLEDGVCGGDTNDSRRDSNADSGERLKDDKLGDEQGGEKGGG